MNEHEFGGYRDALEYLLGRVNYERSSAPSYSRQTFKLDRMAELLSRLGNPQSALRAIHIAGTKGKGSTASILASILTSAGFRTGLYTSPHLDRFEERFQVDGQVASESEFVALMNTLRPVVVQLDRESDWGAITYFEMATALAWMHFFNRGVDFVVLEVGLGGRLDSTNICNPVATVITSISLDHTALLGDRVELIAAEKAGILKDGIPLFCGVPKGPARAAIRRAAAERDGVHCYFIPEDIRFATTVTTFNSVESEQIRTQVVDVETPWKLSSNLPLKLAGAHQAANCALAIGVVDFLTQDCPLPRKVLERSLQNVDCPGRIELVGREPVRVIDGAHNPASINALLDTLDEYYPARPRIVVFATSRDKDARAMLDALVPRVDFVILTEFGSNPRRVSIAEWDQILACSHGQRSPCAEIRRVADCRAAWLLGEALAENDGLVCATGSFFLAAELRRVAMSSESRGFVESSGD